MLTVRGLMKSCSAMSFVDFPSTSNFSTSTSRGVNPYSPAAEVVDGTGRLPTGSTSAALEDDLLDRHGRAARPGGIESGNPQRGSDLGDDLLVRGLQGRFQGRGGLLAEGREGTEDLRGEQFLTMLGGDRGECFERIGDVPLLGDGAIDPQAVEEQRDRALVVAFGVHDLAEEAGSQGDPELELHPPEEPERLFDQCRAALVITLAADRQDRDSALRWHRAPGGPSSV